MKGSVCIVMVVIIVVLPSLVSSRHISRSYTHHGHERHSLKNKPDKTKDGSMSVMRRGPDAVQVAGSRLPDCTHACGSCRPCRLVMVSFVCASLAEAETCPMAYKCMCRNKSYPVP